MFNIIVSIPWRQLVQEFALIFSIELCGFQSPVVAQTAIAGMEK